MSVKFYGVGGVGQIGNIRKSGTVQSTDKASGSRETDQVQFSSILQDISQAQGAGATAETGRTERVAELKAQIADGSYQPDLNKVASSLLQFLMEEK